MQDYNIMLVDDHAIVRDGLKMIFETTDSYKVVAEAENGKRALELLKTVNPDLILLDLMMPEMNGIEFLEEIVDKLQKLPVVVLTTINESDRIQKAIQLGAKGYLLKDASRDVLLRTVEAAIRGEMLLTEQISHQLLKPLSEANYKGSVEDFGLTEREIFILQTVARGDTSRSIAIEMGISERTVKAHLTNIYAKMEVSSRSEAVAKALTNRIIHI